MKLIIVLTNLLLATAAAPAFAHDSQAGIECAKKAAKITTGSSETSAFLTSCLKKIDPSLFIKEEKVEQCVQNAKNYKAEGKKKDEYLEHCFLEDDTHPAADQKPHPKM